MSVNTDELDEATLALFFTFGVSMNTWYEEGMIDRELALYRELAEDLERIYLFTYGNKADLKHNNRVPDNVTIVPKKRITNDLLYSLLCPLIHWRVFREVDIVKTNQMLGSWTALLVKSIFRTSMVIRTGYVLTIFYEELDKPASLRWIATALESISYFFADGVITSSPRGYEYVEDRYIVRGNHQMIPNYIQTDVFKPMEINPKEGTICFVGRLADQKNLPSLLRAVGNTSFSLTIVGGGNRRKELEQLANQVNADVTFRGRVPNHDLPEILNSHEVFVLPSLFEGMPKTLLEAMSCGRPVVGTDVKGINEVITHRDDGLLCDTDADSIHEALHRVLENEKLRNQLGKNARETIVTEYSLRSVANQERGLYLAIK